MGKKQPETVSIGKINTCPRCGGHLSRVSGFWRCDECGHTKFYSQNLRASLGCGPSTSYDAPEPTNEFNIGFDDPDNYMKWKGKYTKRIGKTEELK